MANARRPNATYIPVTGVGGWRRGLVSGLTQILSFESGLMEILALGNAKIYQHVGIFCVRCRKSVALGVQSDASTQCE